MDVLKALGERRSVRKFDPSQQVAEEIVQELLDAARLAPSWQNLQCWRFIVIRDQEKKKQLAESLHEGNPAVKAMEDAPIVIMVCGDPESSGKIDGKEYYLLDAGLALQQLMLAAHARGLGTCWVAWFDEAKARGACRVPEEYKIVAMTPLGFPAKEPKPRPRMEVGEIVYQDEWGKPYTDS